MSITSSGLLDTLSIRKMLEEYGSGALSPTETMRSCIDAVTRLDPKLRAWACFDASKAMARARVAEQRFAGGGQKDACGTASRTARRTVRFEALGRDGQGRGCGSDSGCRGEFQVAGEDRSHGRSGLNRAALALGDLDAAHAALAKSRSSAASARSISSRRNQLCSRCALENRHPARRRHRP